MDPGAPSWEVLVQLERHAPRYRLIYKYLENYNINFWYALFFRTHRFAPMQGITINQSVKIVKTVVHPGVSLILLFTRDYENLILTLDLSGAEVGDLNHSKNLPPRVVECGH